MGRTEFINRHKNYLKLKTFQNFTNAKNVLAKTEITSFLVSNLLCSVNYYMEYSIMEYAIEWLLTVDLEWTVISHRSTRYTYGIMWVARKIKLTGVFRGM